MPFQQHVKLGLSLPGNMGMRIMMRVLWFTGCDYEWAHHVERAHEAGLNDADLAALRRPDAGENDPVIRAVDQLLSDAFIQDPTWAELAKALETQQLIEFIFATGGHAITAMTLNSLGIQLEEGFEAP